MKNKKPKINQSLFVVNCITRYTYIHIPEIDLLFKQQT